MRAADSVDEAGRLDVCGRRVARTPDHRVHRAVQPAGELLEEWGLPVP